METFIQWLVAGVAAVVGPLLTIFDLPGNTLMLLTGLGMAFLYDTINPDLNQLLAMVIIYLLGESWEFFVGLFGIRREKVSWFAVFCIGVGGFTGTVIGTGLFLVLGSFIGGVVGAFLAAFLYEYIHSGTSQNAWHLAWAAAKMRCFALLGKLVAGMVLAVMLVKIIILR